jgi:biopolymer transport protein ExbD
MKISEMEPMSIPPALTDLIFNLLFVFIVLTCTLAAAMGGARELNLQLPELDKGMTEERQGIGGDSVEVVILRSGRIMAAGKDVAGPAGLLGKVRSGQQVVIALEKGATADLLIAVEGQLKKIGVRDVTVLVKEAL